MQNSRNTYIQIKQNIFALKALFFHPATVYLCSFKELHLFNFKEVICLLTVKEILILSNNIYLYIHKKYNHSRQLYSDTKLYSFQGTVSVHSRKYILVHRNTFIQGNYIHSRKCSSSRPYVHSRKLYLLNIVAFADSRNIYSKIVPSHLMIIINFTITVS